MKTKYQILREKVKKLYYAGVWTCDNLPLNKQIKLWKEVRDAAGFEKGLATKLKVGK